MEVVPDNYESSMTDAFWLVTSGAYIAPEMAAEFGQMPPSFLPVGTRRLYEYQFESIGSEVPVYLTVPESYELLADDARRIHALGAVVLPVPDGLQLGDSVVFALNLIGAHRPVRILHGDTLCSAMTELGPDQIGIAVGGEGYSWAEVDLDADRITAMRTLPAGFANDQVRPIVCGLFAFASTVELIRAITRARGSFVAGIMEYAATHVLRALPIHSWYDFGHLQTFFRSRRMVSTARDFNTLAVDGKTVRKSSEDAPKITAEAAWLTSLPPTLRVYCARLIDAGDGQDGISFYETEYCYLPTLSELLVFGKLGKPAWTQIVRSCQDFLMACSEHSDAADGNGLLYELTVRKTVARLRQFSEQTGFDAERMLRYDNRPLPSLVQIAEDVAELIDFASHRPATVMHGDLCFSNILYDSRVQRIHVIDPRGYVYAGRPSIYGDVRYDLAKLAHSIVGRYDHIIAGRYRLEEIDDRRYRISFERAPHDAWLEEALGKLEVAGVNATGREVHAVTIGLFLSMLPLHSDRPDRQKAFIANALRLYAAMETLAK